MKLSGNVALVTGASRGLGFEIAKAYAERGAKLVIAARGGQQLAAAEAELAKETDVVALALDAYPWRELERVFRVNVLAPLHLTQLVLPGMKERGAGTIINVSSDAGVEAYPGWGGYGASKAALEHLARTLAAELDGTGVRVYAVDPGDMNTEMHRLAEPGVDLSGLPGPAASAPAFVQLVVDAPASGRFQAQELLAAVS